MATTQEPTTALVSKNVQAIEQYLVQAQDELARILPAAIGAERQVMIAMELVREDSYLQICEPMSIVQAVVECSQFGVQLGKTLGHGYIVPYKNGKKSEAAKRDVYEAQFIIGYRGFMHKVRQSDPNVASIYARIVWPGEPFRIIEGSEHKLIHEPGFEHPEIKVAQDGSLSGFVGVYAMVTYKDGTAPDFEWLPLSEVEKRRKSAQVKSDKGPWRTWPAEQVQKTGIRKLGKRLKLAPDTVAAFVRDEYREYGVDETSNTPAPPPVRMPRRVGDPPAATVVDTTATTESSTEQLPLPKCPDHDLEMPLKPGKWGDFYGCPKYPRCKHTMKPDAWAKKYAERQAAAAATQPGPTEQASSTAPAGDTQTTENREPGQEG